MKSNLLILNRTADLPQDGWYQIEVGGEHPARGKRIQVIDAASLRSIVNHFREDASEENFPGLLVDADHLSHDLENPTAALAWLKDLAIRGNHLHGRLELTDLGEAAVKGKRYKFFSTEYDANDLEDLGGGRVRPLRLAGLAFTNRPNNVGAKPISNRDGTTTSGGSSPTTETNTPTMKSIAEILGLSADATEADIRQAVSALLDKVAAMETTEKATEADAVMNRMDSRIPEAARPQWRAALITNRAEAEKLMEQSFPALPAKVPRIFNRAEATAPAPVGKVTANKEAGSKAAAILNRAGEISTKEGLPFNQAFHRAAAELA